MHKIINTTYISLEGAIPGDLRLRRDRVRTGRHTYPAPLQSAIVELTYRIAGAS
jgi:hypothetical protein